MPNSRDPYNGFTDDKERGRALRTRERSWAAAWAFAALAGALAPHAMEAVRWLMSLSR